MLIIRPPYDKALCPCLRHETHLHQRLFHDYLLFIIIFVKSSTLSLLSLQQFFISLSLLVTIKCLRNGFMTRIVFFFRCHIEAQYHICIYYGNFTVHYNTISKHQPFPNISPPATVHTLVSSSLHHRFHYTHFSI